MLRFSLDAQWYTALASKSSGEWHSAKMASTSEATTNPTRRSGFWAQAAVTATVRQHTARANNRKNINL
jgi:hypothetical protein